jgi:hypothetical protein
MQLDRHKLFDEQITSARVKPERQVTISERGTHCSVKPTLLITNRQTPHATGGMSAQFAADGHRRGPEQYGNGTHFFMKIICSHSIRSAVNPCMSRCRPRISSQSLSLEAFARPRLEATKVHWWRISSFRTVEIGEERKIGAPPSSARSVYRASKRVTLSNATTEGPRLQLRDRLARLHGRGQRDHFCRLYARALPAFQLSSTFQKLYNCTGTHFELQLRTHHVRSTEYRMDRRTAYRPIGGRDVLFGVRVMSNVQLYSEGTCRSSYLDGMGSL